MDGWMYPASLAVLALLAFVFNQNHNNKLTIIAVLIGVYIVYSHETGYTATDFRNDTVESIDESANEWSKNSGTSGFDEVGAQKSVK